MIKSRDEFYRRITDDPLFEGEVFDLPGQKITVQGFNHNWITFSKCTFNCDLLEFKNIINPELIIEFKECTFNCELAFSNCNLDMLKFSDTKSLKLLDIRNGLSDNSIFELNVFQFSNNSAPLAELNTNFYFRNIVVKRIFAFENIKNTQGDFQFLDNTLGSDANSDCQILLSKSQFNNAKFIGNIFNDIAYFKSANLNSVTFYNNTFDKIDFTYSSFSKKIEFNTCDFLGTTWFEDCKNGQDAFLKFVACKFERYSLFDNSKFNKTEILHSKFKEKASFENFETVFFTLHQVSFSEAAYFDDLNKNNNDAVAGWDRKTLRAIKRELVNTHNQIDYLRFKAYELNAYKNEVDKDKLSWKDAAILYFNYQSNNFGLDWMKGIRFIFQWSFLFYILYIISYAERFDGLLHFSANDYFVNYLKFINPFSFLKPPIEESENHFLPFLFFLIGKIFVSYGIYQTVQAFRKFGVNGG